MIFFIYKNINFFIININILTMLTKIFNKFITTHNDRVLQRINKIVQYINHIEDDIEKLSDKQLSSKTVEFRSRIDKGEKINNILPEAFAVVREASKRIFGMRHFDVQLLGGIVLHDRCIAEMRTGEGKTLTSTLPAYLNALSGKGVHIVTVNDYLAKRDAHNNRPLFEFLGLTVGINLPGLSVKDKQTAYLADITYGTNNEYGFDYLRDNMIFNKKDKVQRTLYYALVDEVDSILIDEARTPLIISGQTEDNSEIYKKIDKLIYHFIYPKKNDSQQKLFSVDEKTRQVTISEKGLIYIEQLMVKSGLMPEDESLYSPNNIMLMHHINAAIRAHKLFFRNVDYIIKNNEVIIVDEHTGRTMPGRRWSDGLHQAIEAKEKVPIRNENQTLASITFQNYFRLYEKLAGMTGTAYTEAFEFREIYNLDTIVIPTNKPMIRKDLPDLIYMTSKEKIDAIIKDVIDCVSRGQPVLVGTISIEKSEEISTKLVKLGIVHKVLNAKFHTMEAEIIAQAGKPGSVTIATNMAGRGTDIVLGGNYKSEINKLNIKNKNEILKIKEMWKKSNDFVISVGGLHIIGTERHESRRIDNQLRGRSGRQGDIGSSRFYLSMEDSLIRIFASNRLILLMKRLGMKIGEALEHPWITKAIANAQRQVENLNFEIRKQLLEYDDVANDQRQAIYSQRDFFLNTNDISNTIKNFRKNVITNVIDTYIPPLSRKESWKISDLEKHLRNDFCLLIPISKWIKNQPSLDEKSLKKLILESSKYEIKSVDTNTNIRNNMEKFVMLNTIDFLWKEHLAAMDYLLQGINLRSYAQMDPKQEYKRESFAMFTSMLEALKYEVTSNLSKMNIYHNEIQTSLCPCNSGQKFTICHGKLC